MGSSWFKFGRKRTPIEGRCNGVLFLGDPENDIQSKRRRRRWAAVQRKQTKANHIDEQIGECVGMAAKFSDAHSSWQSRSIHAKPKYNVWGFVGCCSILLGGHFSSLAGAQQSIIVAKTRRAVH